MKTTRNRIAIESSSAPAHPDLIAQGINSSETGINIRSNISILFAKILMFFSLGLILLSSCSKTDDLTPLSDDNIINLKAEVAAYYIAPNGSDAATGDITHPFATLNKAWTKVVAGDLVYMRGGTYVYNSTQNLQNKSGTVGNPIKIWAYPGETPIITKGTSFSTGVGPWLVYLHTASYIHLKGIDISGFTQQTAVVWIGLLGQDVNNCTFENLNIHHNGMGMGISHNSAGNLILNCDFHHNADPLGSGGRTYNSGDGLWIAYIDGAAVSGTNTIRGCRSWWNTDDGIDLFENSGNVVLENCWTFWNGYFPGTFNSSGEGSNYGNGDGFKLGQTGNLASSLKRTLTNCLAFENREIGFDQNNAVCIMNLYNNTAYKNGTYGFLLSHQYNIYSLPIVLKNNISYANGSVGTANLASIVDHNTYKLVSGNVTLQNNTSFSITNADFASISSTGMDGARQSDGSQPVLSFMHLVAGSDLVNTGVNVGIPYNGTLPDLGAFELTSGSSSSNNPPTIQNQTFQLIANSSNGTAVGTVVATDPDAGQTLTYSILSGNTNGAFVINTSTGALTVANSSALNFVTNPTFTMIVKVLDNGTGTLSSTATITVNLSNTTIVNGYPIIANQSFSVSRSASNGTVVGTVIASDPNAGQLITYSIIAGNSSNAFSINSTSGKITVKNKWALKYRHTPFLLTVKIKDNGTPSLSSQATITINVI